MGFFDFFKSKSKQNQTSSFQSNAMQVFCYLEHNVFPTLILEEDEDGYKQDLYDVVSRMSETCITVFGRMNIDFKSFVSQFSLKGGFNASRLTDVSNSSGESFYIIVLEFPFREGPACNGLCPRAYVTCDLNGNKRAYSAIVYNSSSGQAGGDYCLYTWYYTGGSDGNSISPFNMGPIGKANKDLEMRIISGFASEYY